MIELFALQHPLNSGTETLLLKQIFGNLFLEEPAPQHGNQHAHFLLAADCYPQNAHE